jgi:hypothetical protein
MKFKFKIHAVQMKNHPQHHRLKLQWAQIPPQIWMTLPLEAKKWLLNERKCQKQEDDKMKKSLALSKSIAASNDKDSNNSDMPNYMQE